MSIMRCSAVPGTSLAVLAASVLVAVSVGCEKPWPFIEDRYAKIPADARKGTPATDPFPPVLLSSEYEEPVPMPGPINSMGGEDSPFISTDGTEFFFFYTPDVRVPAELQVLDSVTGIWCSRLSNGAWTEPERVILSDREAMDGCEQLIGDTLWFASIRSRDMLGDIDVFTAVRRNGEWQDWRNAGEQLNVEYNIGEFHLTSDHQTMYFGNPEGASNYDLWRTERTATGWDAPVRLGASVNDTCDQLQPFVTTDMQQLWYTGWNAQWMGPCVYRSLRDSTGEWGSAELIVARFAGEPTLDDSGNLYFVHHFYTGGDSSRMLEADIYYCRKR